MSKISLNLNFNEFFSKTQMKKKTKLYFVEKGYENYKISKFSQYISLALIMFMEDFFTNGIAYISKNELNGLYIFKKKYMSLVFTNYDFLQKYLSKYNDKIAYDGNLFFNVNKVYKNLEYKVGEKIMFEYEAKNYLNYLMVCIQYDIIEIAVSIISYNCKKTFTKDLFLQYKKHLGSFRYYLMLLVQSCMCHTIVKKQLKLKFGLISFTLIQLYKMSREINVDSFIKNQFLPDEYKERIKALNAV